MKKTTREDFACACAAQDAWTTQASGCADGKKPGCTCPCHGGKR